MSITTGDTSRTMQGPTCKHCESSEARCAWMQPCCLSCTHAYGERARRRAKLEARANPVPAGRPIIACPHPAPHRLNLDDPIDRLYLELLPTRPGNYSGPPMDHAVLMDLVREVCPSDFDRREVA